MAHYKVCMKWSDIDYYVYALGQDPSKGERSVVRLLADALSMPEDTKRIPDAKLEPLIDKNFSMFDTRTQSPDMPQGIVGLRLNHGADKPICEALRR